MKLNKFFLISWKKVILIVGGWILAVILHNAFYALFGVEEAVFFIIAVIIIPVYTLIFIVYNVIKLIQGKIKK